MGDPGVPLLGYDAIELWVGNAKQAAHYYRTALGFRLVAYAGPETGVRDHASYVLTQGGIRIVLSSGLSPGDERARHQARHGDAVRDVAFRVQDATRVFGTAIERGATPLSAPVEHADDGGRVVLASIAGVGDTIHSFVERDAYHGPYRPGFVGVAHDPLADPVGLEAVDHVVANVEHGRMDHWVDFYARTLALSPVRHFDDGDVSTDDTALRSTVLGDDDGRIRIPVNEPAAGPKRSQIEEYLEANGGPGIQHLALRTSDIVETVTRLRERGVSFLEVPRTYYAQAMRRIDGLEESWSDLSRLGLLVDRDDEGYLLQTFTEPLQDRPTLFLEIIQRRGATGFGLGNFRALFEAIERAQRRRGNL